MLIYGANIMNVQGPNHSRIPSLLIPLPDQILEDERNQEPRTIVDACSRWDGSETSDEHGCVDEADP